MRKKKKNNQPKQENVSFPLVEFCPGRKRIPLNDLSTVLSKVIQMLTRTALKHFKKPSKKNGYFFDRFDEKIRFSNENKRTISGCLSVAVEHNAAEVLTQLRNLKMLSNLVITLLEDPGLKNAKIRECHPTQTYSDEFWSDLVVETKKMLRCYEVTAANSPSNNDKWEKTIKKFKKVSKPGNIEFFIVGPVEAAWIIKVMENGLSSQKCVIANVSKDVRKKTQKKKRKPGK